MGQLLYTCCFFFTFMALGRSECPSGYKLVRGTCYRLADNTLTWGDAQGACAGDEFEAALVSISSKGKFGEVMFFINSQGASHNGYWLCANDCVVEGNFVWHSVPGTQPVVGTEIDPDPNHNAPVNSLWCKGRPRMDNDKNCLSLTLTGTCFEDEACGSKLGVICEAPPLETTAMNMTEIVYSSPKYAVGNLYLPH